MADLPDDQASTRTVETNTSDGDALRAFMSGSGDTSSVESTENADFIEKLSGTTDLDALADKMESEPQVDPESAEKPQTTEPTVEDEPATEGEELEFKVKGFKAPVKVPKNWEDPKVQEYINKGIRFDKRMAELAQVQKDLQAKIDSYSDYEDKAEVATRVQTARELAEQGHREHAIKVLLGENSDEYIDSLVEERIKYRDASPEERLAMDVERERRDKALAEKQMADKIAALEARLEKRSESVQEAEYSGYIEDAKGRYDLGQWVSDPEEASDLNDMLEAAAMRDIVRLQRKREAEGRDNISQADIRRAFATRAKRLLGKLNSESDRKADAKISQTAETAAKNAQVASTKSYAKDSDAVSGWAKSGGSMSDLVNMLRRPGGTV